MSKIIDRNKQQKRGNKMSKQVVKKETNNNISTELAGVLSDFQNMSISAEDIIMPRLLLMQQMSPQVVEAKAKLGEIVDNLSGEVLAPLDGALEVLPLKVEKQWVEYTQVNSTSKKEWVRTTPAGAEFKPFREEHADGSVTTCDLVFTIYFLTKANAEAAQGLPHVVTFKSTSFKTGKWIFTQMIVNARYGKAPWANFIKLSGRKEDGNKGTYAVFAASVGAPVTETANVTAHGVYKTIKVGESMDGNKKENS